MQVYCKCGQAIPLSPGKTSGRCKDPGCKAIWWTDMHGVWAGDFRRKHFDLLFTPKPRKLNHYERYMKWRNRSMKQGKNPTRAQKDRPKKPRLDPANCMITKDCPECFDIVHRVTKETRRLEFARK
ncbi:MAG: DUF6906 family protein [Desulfitobacteriaceae bacterium]